MTRIALAGNQWITRHLLRRLVDGGFTPALIINMPPDRSSSISGYADLASEAAMLGARLYRPAAYSLTTQEDREALTAEPVDVLLVFGWQRLIPDWLIRHCHRGAFGVHGGMEPPPRCRGRAVFNWAIMLGYDRFHMYLFRITADADSGPILDTADFTITLHDDIASVYHKNCLVSADMILRNLPAMVAGLAHGTPQPSEGATYLPGRKPENGGIDWSQDAEAIADFVRALAPPYPGAFGTLNGQDITIHRAHPFDPELDLGGAPGTIVEIFPNGHFLVATGRGALYVRDHQPGIASVARRGDRFQLVSGTPLPVPAF